MSQNTAQSLPKVKPDEERYLHLVTEQRKMGQTKWTGQEIIMAAICILVVLGCLIGMVASSGAVSTANRDLAIAQNKVDSIGNKNSNLKQEINELTSHNRLQKIANHYGLSLSNQNIRNVSK
ncbi:cell division protein FtsL [Periweissella fabalis]|uniref:Cell division protein FtsL n=1 Tax=Periweissella fabalis TaxID=1070421 RepID=A0A7X6S3S5_9LACO|nr:cell division protein FtsL [Periweissella fabalis]MCM0598478.1 cell division protein FtsL [Periweissella fabalis]NKZ24242.1 cell division protein FtsL [Periweissella fabalis]